MNNENIEPGDDVMIVRGTPCCGALGPYTYGQVLTVDKLYTTGFIGHCRKCLTVLPPGKVFVIHDGMGRAGPYLEMVKKMPPKSKDEPIEEVKDIEHEIPQV